MTKAPGLRPGPGGLGRVQRATTVVVIAALSIPACARDEVRRGQAVTLRDTCVSMLERAYPDSPGLARDAGSSDPGTYLMPHGSSSARRTVDVLMANCSHGPFGPQDRRTARP
jgi:hypothetical protein